MDNFELLLAILKSNDFKKFIDYYFDIYSEKLNKKITKSDFSKYFRAFILDLFMRLDNDKQDKFIVRIASANFSDIEFEYFVFTLNACCSKVNDHIDKDSEEFFKELEPYRDRPICKALAKHKEEIFKFAAEDIGGIYTIEQIRNGEYEVVTDDDEEYILDDEEIKTIEAAHKANLLLDLSHSIYDDIEFKIIPTFLGSTEVRKSISCDYETADADGLGNLVFNTGKEYPKLELDIVFEDGIIMTYHKGDIRKKQYNLDELLSYIYAHMARDFELQELDVNNLSDLDPKRFKSIMSWACLAVVSNSDCLVDIYSKKMIDSSKKYVKSLKKLAEENNL